MAIDEEVQNRLDRLLIRVQGGQGIAEATKAENCFYWYYNKLKNHQRAPIIRARREYETRQQVGPQVFSPQNHFLHIEVPLERKDDFRHMCEGMGISMAQRVNTLIAADLSTNRTNFM